MQYTSVTSVSMFMALLINLVPNEGLGSFEETCDIANSLCTNTNETQDVSSLLVKFGYAKHAFTTDADYEQRQKLDAADELIISEPELALSRFNEILESSPESPRANYARIRCMQVILDEHKEDEQLDFDAEFVANAFVEFVIRAKKWPKALIEGAVAQGLILCSKYGLHTTKTRLIREAMRIDRDSRSNPRLHLLLISSLLRQKELGEDALQALDEALEQFGSKMFIFRLIKGALLRSMGGERSKEGRAILRDMDDVEKENDRVAIAADINDVAQEIRDAMESNESKEYNAKMVDLLFSEASKLHLFPSKLQRPLNIVPDITAKPIWTDEKKLSNFIDLLKNNLDVFRKEIEAVSNDDLVWSKLDWTFIEKGEWRRIRLFSFGKRHFEICASRMRATCTVLKLINMCDMGNARIEHMAANTISKPINGPTNARLRIALAIKGNVNIKVGNEEMSLKENETVVFDDSFEHKWSNDDKWSNDTFVLVVDVWHPELNEEQRKSGFNAYWRSYFLDF